MATLQLWIGFDHFFEAARIARYIRNVLRSLASSDQPDADVPRMDYAHNAKLNVKPNLPQSKSDQMLIFDILTLICHIFVMGKFC